MKIVTPATDLLPTRGHRMFAVAVLLSTFAASALVATPAKATETLPKPVEVIAPPNVDDLREAMTKSGLPHETQLDDGRVIERFTLPSGSTMVIPAANTRLNAGWEGTTPYIQLNRTDQQALLNGSAVALGAALCAIPAVGWAACGAIGTALAVGMTYLRGHGICSGSKPNMRTTLNGSLATRCVS